jgi:hypothetical protein
MFGWTNWREKWPDLLQKHSATNFTLKYFVILAGISTP